MDDLKDFINELIRESAIPLNPMYDSLPQFIHSQNCKYFDILDTTPVFNIFRLLGVNYKHTLNGFFITRNDNPYKMLQSKMKVISINSLLPEIGLSHFNKIYTLICQTSLGIKLSLDIKYPQLLNRSMIIEKNKIYYSKNTILIKLINFTDISFINFYQLHEKDLWIDLRNNQGGEVKQLLTFLSYFYPHDDLKFYLKKQSRVFRVCRSNSGLYVKPRRIFLIVNNKTASAAEMLALKLKKDFTSKVIGNITEGKWIINSIKAYNEYFIKFPEYLFTLYEDTTLTIGKGILPDICVPDSIIDKFLRQKFAI